MAITAFFKWQGLLAGAGVLLACDSGGGGSEKLGSGAPVSGDPAFDYAKQEVTLTEELLVPAGKVVKVGPGAIFHASSAVTIRVRGKLLVEGTAEAPAQFLGGGVPHSWHGIVVEAGGELSLSHAQIGGASYGIHALPGSDFMVTNSKIDTSFKAAVVESDGRFENTTFKAGPSDTIAVTDEVTIDDPNGTLTIMDASPSVSNCQFDGASVFTDMVRIGGNASPVLDHVYLHNAHCGFHTFGGTNTSPHISHAIFENLAFGIMAYTAKPIIEDSVFRMNSTDVGMCHDATADNAPVLRNNHYTGGTPAVDASCAQIGTSDASPAQKPNAEAGPSGL